MTQTPQLRPSSGIRVAEFIANVGEGNKFSKIELFDAVPGVSQADRRMRDLREMGWVIDNYKMNPTLKPDEYLLKKIGTRIHEGQPRPKSVRRSVTGPKRRRILERDGHTCQVCGVRAGMDYPGEPGRKAVLTIGHIIPNSRGGSDDESNLRAECTRCGDQARDITMDPPSAASIFTRAQHVGGLKEKKRLYGWMAAGHRTLDDTEAVFNDWARLPRAQRLEVMNQLGQQVITEME
ncbi:HNH endonuclease [Arthrobacter crusticola]|uniref:HNH endonuclease n=1 Tax=Arthrobacter crusticola TaxID=2547960 RepID=A0A4R5TZC0_9MICC|nr:HNH endonuclease [Arthrobacter crusticola]TDK26590.1 HNH endonuclease [Arthrobacter crusticola]